MKERLEAFVAVRHHLPGPHPVCPPEELAGMIDALAR